jgi:hypothetical protein
MTMIVSYAREAPSRKLELRVLCVTTLVLVPVLVPVPTTVLYTRTGTSTRTRTTVLSFNPRNDELLVCGTADVTCQWLTY